MFALPVISAGSWMIWSSLGLILVWLVTYLAASMLAKIIIALASSGASKINYQSSFSSLVNQTLGQHWEAVNNLSIVFIMMVLMYAYSTAGGSIVAYSFENAGYPINQSSRQWFSLVFAMLIGILVWLGTSIVSRVVLILMIVMAVAFGLASFGIFNIVEIQNLVVSTPTAHFTLIAIPVYVTAFACAGLVPSLVQHYQTRPVNVHRSLYWGTALALLVYLFWLVIAFGSIGREGFSAIIASGGNISDLSTALTETGATLNVESRLTLFSHCAVISSFLGVAVGLLHFVQDKLSLNKNARQRFKAAAICILPPAIASFVYPYGFVQAIGLAGLFVAFSFFVVPGMIALKVKHLQLTNIPQAIPAIVIGFGVIVFVLKCASLFSLLPDYD